MIKRWLAIFEILVLLSTLTEEKVCYEGIGCFSRRISSLKAWLWPPPWSPSRIAPSVKLFTRNDSKGEYHQPLAPLKFNTTDSSDFDPGRSVTLFITHGFSNSGESEWIKDLRNAYLNKVDANVFVLDWGNGANHLNYLQVATNIRVVGILLARFVKYLIKTTGIKPNNIHLMGHSLGAHVMAYCAKNISELGQIGRITGFDPARFGFDKASKNMRLDPSDAIHVDVLHTDARAFVGLGMKYASGTVDFYFNGGQFQPGCLLEKDFKINFLSLAALPAGALYNLVACSHSRSYSYFIAAINNEHCFLAHRVHSLRVITEIISRGFITFGIDDKDCNLETCTVVGLHTFKLPARGIFVVETGETSPFCGAEESRSIVYSLLSNTVGKVYNCIKSKIKIVKNVISFGKQLIF